MGGVRVVGVGVVGEEGVFEVGRKGLKGGEVVGVGDVEVGEDWVDDVVGDGDSGVKGGDGEGMVGVKGGGDVRVRRWEEIV